MPRVNAEHDCVKTKCKGQRLNGIYIKCNRCEKKWMLECLSEEDEIYVLLKTIGIIKLTQDETTGQVNTIINITEDKQNAFHAIIGEESPIEYACLTCKKKEGSTKKYIKQLQTAVLYTDNQKKEAIKTKNELEKRIETQNQTINENEETINDLKATIETQKRTISENEATICDLTMTIEQNRVSGMEKESKDDDDDDENSDKNDESDLNKMKRMIKKTVKEQMKIETEKIEQIIRATVKGQSDRIRNVTFDDDLISGIVENENNENKQNEREIQFDTKLIPTKQINKNERERAMYEIYVSKFECDKTKEAIEKHITTNTNIDRLTYTVEEIRSNSDSRQAPNYKAFKIRTLRREIYDEIKDIWAPYYKAREFKPKMYERGQTTTNLYNEQATNINNRTPYRMRTNDTRYETNNQNRQFTPGRNMSHNRNEQNRATTNNNFTPQRYYNNTERRETGQRYNRQPEQQNRTQQTNTQSNFLDNNRHSQPGNPFRQGVNQQQQGRSQQTMVYQRNNNHNRN